MDDVITLAQFQEEVRRNARFTASAPPAEALAAAVQAITANPAFSQSRLLGRMLRALTEKGGQFRRAEVSAFDTPTLRLAVSLMDAESAGTNTRAEWLEAVAATAAMPNG